MLLSDILSFCNSTLQIENFSDYAKNGLQIQGNRDVQKIALGVSASKFFLEQAANWGADLCICHHGIIFGKIDMINDVLAGRLRIILEYNMSVCGYHLPLDAHDTLGNNAALCDLLGLKNKEKIDIGFSGNLQIPLPWNEFITLVQKTINPDISFSEHITGKEVSRVCVISGGASGYSKQAIDSGADTFLFGEIKESSVHEMRERNLNYVAAGHYATEVWGVQRLGDALKKEFNKKNNQIECRFFEEECDV